MLLWIYPNRDTITDVSGIFARNVVGTDGGYAPILVPPTVHLTMTWTTHPQIQRGGSHTSGTRYHRDSHDYHTKDSRQRDLRAKGNHFWKAPSERSDSSSSPAPWRTPYDDPWNSRHSQSLQWRDRSPTPFPRETLTPRRNPFEEPRGRSR